MKSNACKGDEINMLMHIIHCILQTTSIQSSLFFSPLFLGGVFTESRLCVFPFMSHCLPKLSGNQIQVARTGSYTSCIGWSCNGWVLWPEIRKKGRSIPKVSSFGYLLSQGLGGLYPTWRGTSVSLTSYKELWMKHHSC